MFLAAPASSTLRGGGEGRALPSPSLLRGLSGAVLQEAPSPTWVPFLTESSERGLLTLTPTFLVHKLCFSLPLAPATCHQLFSGSLWTCFSLPGWMLNSEDRTRTALSPLSPRAPRQSAHCLLANEHISLLQHLPGGVSGAGGGASSW